MKVPHITVTDEHWIAADKATGGYNYVEMCNKAIEIALAEQSQEQYITAEKYMTHDEVGAMGVGSMEFYDPRTANWSLNPPYGVERFKCRSVKKNTDEQSLITAEDARKLGVGNAEYQSSLGVWKKLDHDFYTHASECDDLLLYRAIKQPEPAEPTCQIKNLDTGITKTMTREAAKLLQAELGDKVEWGFDGISISNGYNLQFDNQVDLYTYKLKAKPLKQIEWKDVPQFVCVRNKDFREFLFLGVSEGGNTAYVFNRNHPKIAFQMLHNIELAPADQQPWLNWRGGECPVPKGVMVEVTYRNDCRELDEGVSFAWGRYGNMGEIIEYRITGIQRGYKL